MRMPVVVGLGLVTLLAACAPTPRVAAGETSARADQCFNVRQVNNFRQGRADQLFLRVGRTDVYELNTAGGCMDLDFAVQLAIVSDHGGAAGSRLCTGDWARVIVPDSTSPASTCRVRVSRQLTAEEVTALPAAHRP